MIKTNVEECPVWPKIKARFPAADPNTTCIAYFPYVYSAHPMHPCVIRHEAVHLAQQDVMGVEKWWEEYLKDPAFVKAMEWEAYQEQARFVREGPYDRNEQARILFKLKADMTGPLYNEAFGSQEAKKILGIT